MKTPLKKEFLTAALALVFFAVPLAALSAEETAQYYVNPGEGVSVVNFSAGAARYAMVKISGGESIVLKEAPGGFEAIANESELTPLVSEYLQQQFDVLGFEPRASAIKTNFEAFKTESEKCVEAAKKLIRMSRTTPPYLYITTNAGRDYPKEYAALMTLNATLPVFEKAYNATRDVAQSIEGTVASRKADVAVEAFNEVRSQANAFKTAYVNVSKSRATIIATFPNAFLLQVDLKNHCELDSNQTAAVDAVITQSSLGAIKSVSELAKQIALVTASRNPGAKKRMLDAVQRRRISEIAEQIANASEDYAEAARAAGASAPNLTILWRQLGELNALHAQTNNATNDSTAFAAAFDRKARETDEKIALFKATRKDYADSLAAVDNATREVDKIAKKYGANDERVAALQKDLRSLQVLSRSYNDLLRDAMTTGASFQAVTANATVLSARAATLAPKENQLDFVLIGGVVILVGAVVGVFYYIRKKKQEGAMVFAPPQNPAAQRPPY